MLTYQYYYFLNILFVRLILHSPVSYMSWPCPFTSVLLLIYQASLCLVSCSVILFNFRIYIRTNNCVISVYNITLIQPTIYLSQVGYMIPGLPFYLFKIFVFSLSLEIVESIPSSSTHLNLCFPLSLFCIQFFLLLLFVVISRNTNGVFNSY